MNENKLNPAKIILVLIILLSFGTVMGVVGFSLGLKNSPPVAVQPAVKPTITPTIEPTPTPYSETADWNTYTNEKYGYEIKYPKDWEIIYLSKFSAGNTGINLRSPHYQPVQDGNVTHEGEIYVDGIDNPKNLSIKDLYHTFNDTGRFWFEEFEHKDITVNGNPAVLFENIRESKESKITRTDIDIQGNKKVVSFSYLFLENPNKEVKEIYDKIVSTFKFTE